MAVVPYLYAHTHIYDGTGGTSTPNGDHVVAVIPPGFYGEQYVAIDLSCVGGGPEFRGVTNTRIQYLGTQGIDHWSYIQEMEPPWTSYIAPVLTSCESTYYLRYSYLGQPRQLRMDSQNFQGFMIVQASFLTEGATIVDQWTVTGIIDVPFIPHNGFLGELSPLDPPSVETDYWHKIGILVVLIYPGYDFNQDGTPFPNPDPPFPGFQAGFPVFAVVPEATDTGFSSITYKNYFNDPNLFSLFPPPTLNVYIWRALRYVTYAPDNHGFNMTTDPDSIWTLGAFSVIHGVDWFKDEDFPFPIVPPPPAPQIPPFVRERVASHNYDYSYYAEAMNAYDEGVALDDPIGQLVIHGIDNVYNYDPGGTYLGKNASTSNLPFLQDFRPKPPGVQVMHHGWAP